MWDFHVDIDRGVQYLLPEQVEMLEHPEAQEPIDVRGPDDTPQEGVDGQ